MDPNEMRAMRDRHAVDEAALRREQQRDAGDTQSPVEAYPQHGAQSVGPHPDELVARYESAMDEERAAWKRVKAAGQASEFSAAWDEWRALVEKRDEATRFLINQSMSRASS
jgi:hypothetical protein